MNSTNQLVQLFEMRELTQDEGERVERQLPDLFGYTANAIFSSVEALHTATVDSGVLAWNVKRFDFAERWHRWRGRVETAELYRTSASNIAQVLRERTGITQPTAKWPPANIERR